MRLLSEVGAARSRTSGILCWSGKGGGEISEDRTTRNHGPTGCEPEDGRIWHNTRWALSKTGHMLAWKRVSVEANGWNNMGRIF